MKLIKILPVISGLIFFGCNHQTKETTENDNNPQTTQEEMQTIKENPFGQTANGDMATLYTLTNKNGMVVKVTNYGGIITNILTPDNKGQLEDIVLGYDSLQGYLDSSPYFGALIGRYGNRIAGGTFRLEGKTYTLAQNDGKNTLHGGIKGFDKVLWNATPIEDKNALSLTYTSADMEEGFPGKLTVKVVYTLTDDNILQIAYEASTDKATVLNLTNHTYFNLSGNAKRDILNDELQIDAEHFLPVDKTLIPTGELRPVEGTPFDFTKMTTIGKRIEGNNEQLEFAHGYDHCWVFTDSSDQIKEVARLYDPANGREVVVRTDQPAVQFYTGNFLDGSITGKYNVTYQKRYAVCLETQHYPDSPNQPDFPTTTLKPGETYKTTTEYQFDIKK